MGPLRALAFVTKGSPRFLLVLFFCIKEKYGNVLYAWAMASLRACCSSSVNL